MRRLRITRTKLAERILFYACIFGALALFFAGAGCGTRHLEHERRVTTHPDGTKVETIRVTYDNNGFETAAGVFKVERDEHGNPMLTIENLSSDDRGAQALIEGFKAVQSVAP